VLGWVFAQRLAYLPFGSAGAVMPDGVVLAKAILGGVGVGCVASYAACVAAERVDRLSGRRHGRPPTRAFPRTRVTAVLAATAILVVGITVEGAGIAGAFAAILALCICQVVLVLPAVTVGLERLFNRRRGKLLTTANLRSFVSKLSEIRIAAGALSIAIAASVGISGMVENFRADFMQLLDLRLWEGLYLEDAQDADIARIASLPGVIDVRRYARFNASSAGHRLSVSLANTDARETARYGYRGALTDGVMLSEVGERLFGVTVGDGIAIDGVEFAIRHVFKDYGAPSPRVIVPLELSGRLLGAGAGPVVFDRASVLTDPARLDSVRGAIAREFPNIRMRDQQEIRQFSVGVFDRTFKITSSLTLIALIVAVVGLYNALSALQLRRRGEFRLLHTLGLPRLALTSMAMSQSATIGVVAALSAIPLGLGISYLLCEFVNPRAFGWTITFTVNWTRLAEPVLLGIVAAILAGLIPAYNATRGMHAVSTYAFE
jgi:putative ABC transport system permease protein